MDNSNIKVVTSRPAYIYSIISITLVLFVLGLLGMFMIHAQNMSNYFKENVELTLVIDEQVAIEKINQLQLQLQNLKYIKNVEYISKEDAAKLFVADYKEDFTEVLGYNPLFASLNVYLQANYAHMDSLQWIKSTLLSSPIVQEVFYQERLIKVINSNTKRIGFVLFIIGILLLMMAFALIDNTIRLAMYANRFLIKTMQLVGATRQFITHPFLINSIYTGFFSSLLAVFLLFLLQLLIQKNIPELALEQSFAGFSIVCFSVIIIGIGISWCSTQLAVFKYIKSQLNDLY